MADNWDTSGIPKIKLPLKYKDLTKEQKINIARIASDLILHGRTGRASIDGYCIRKSVHALIAVISKTPRNYPKSKRIKKHV